jgi:hypothetical protein
MSYQSENKNAAKLFMILGGVGALAFVTPLIVGLSTAVGLAGGMFLIIAVRTPTRSHEDWLAKQAAEAAVKELIDRLR